MYLIDKLVFNIKLDAVKKLVQPGKTLDIGCGDKLYTVHLPNPVGIDVAKEYEGHVNTPDYWMDARKLEFEDETFDTACLLDVLEHIPGTDLVIKQVHRVLKPNGVMVVTDPNDTVLFWARLLCGRFRDAFKGNPLHIHRFNRDKLLNMTKSLFKLEKTISRGIFTAYRFRRIEQ